MYIAGVDIGNATTETALGRVENGRLVSCVSGIAGTTGIKGTDENIAGIVRSLENAAKKMEITIGEIGRIRINEAAPVIGDFAMETITETIITESTLVGHNPDTPGGAGIGTGVTIKIGDLDEAPSDRSYIPIVSGEYDFTDVAETINRNLKRGLDISGAVLKKDDGVLVSNRTDRIIPIVDEVERIDMIPIGMKCAVEVASPGSCIELLSDPFGIASVFDLDADETKQIVHIARALIGNRSAVVIRTPKGDIRERRIPAGDIIYIRDGREFKAPVDGGASEIMDTQSRAGDYDDVRGSVGTNAGGMIENVRSMMSKLTGRASSDIHIRDIFAVDTVIPREVRGGMAGEFSLEKAVSIAAMVKTDRLNMERLAQKLSDELTIPVEIGGAEGNMAAIGALTTPGTKRPVLVVDIGAGSTDSCMMDEEGKTVHVHLAGAGNMVTALIASELGISDLELAENIKRYPLAKVMSLYHIRHEDGSLEFFDEPIESSLFAHTVILSPDGWKPVRIRSNMEKIVRVRRDAKRKVIISNISRALTKVSRTGNIGEFDQVILVGGSSLDFEIGNMVTDALLYYGIVSGKANVRRTEGPRNAVATGLLLSCIGEANGKDDDQDIS